MPTSIENLPTATRCAVTFLPEGVMVEVEPGTTILRAAHRAGVQIDAPCGERGRCGKCRIRIVDGNAGELAAEEIKLLKDWELDAGIRLSCVAQVDGPLTIEVPETSRNLAHRKASAVLPYPIAPDAFTSKRCVQVAEPSLATADLRADLTRLRAAVPQVNSANVVAVRALHAALVAGKYCVTAVLAGDRLIDIEPGDTTHAHYGLALDIGTTSMVGYLIDLNVGKEVAVCALPNPQATYGSDVISRIEYAQRNAKHTEALRKSVTSGVNHILQSVAKDVNISTHQIYQIVVVGNTCMSHLFLGLDPVSLGHAPYTPVITDQFSLTAGELGLDLHPRGSVRLLPNIAGFVGADTVGVLAASQLEKRTGLNVAVDIGTNAEVMVGLNGHVIACSTAAGPAFEGAKISQGMRAQGGAIDSVTIGEDLFFHTIGDQLPIGICGSGVIDAIGEMRRVEMIDSSGRIADPDDLPALPQALHDRMQEDGIILVWAKDSGTGQDILLTQQDIREIQLVKGAIYAGISTLLEKLGHTPDELDSLLIAGAFGTFITKEHALNIGIIPNIPLEKLIFLGNAAGTGAKMALISQQEFLAICAAAGRVGYVELAGDTTFSNYFMTSMLLAPGCEED